MVQQFYGVILSDNAKITILNGHKIIFCWLETSDSKLTEYAVMSTRQSLFEINYIAFPGSLFSPQSYKINILLLWHPNGFQIPDYIHCHCCNTQLPPVSGMYSVKDKECVVGEKEVCELSDAVKESSLQQPPPPPLRFMV